MYEYIRDNPSLIVNGFVKAGIPQAIDDFQIPSEDSSTTICDGNSDVDSTDSAVDLIA